jgi:hypothetical protein
MLPVCHQKQGSRSALIRIDFGMLDPDPGGKNDRQKKVTKFHGFGVLNVLF